MTTSSPRLLYYQQTTTMENIINQSKKRKTLNDTVSLTQQDARKILQPLTKDQLIDILQTLITHDVAALSAVRSIADTDPSHRNLFIHGLGWDTTTATLKSVFEQYGEVEEGLVIVDKATNKSKGYGFITFKHVDGAVKALVEPSKKIDGRITVARLASARGVVNNNNVENRKVYVGNLPWEVGNERLLECFAAFGEIEEGPLGFEKKSGMAKGFAIFVYKSEEGARKAVVDSVKSIDGYQVMCKMAVDGKKGGAGGGMMPSRGPVPGIVNADGRTSYSGYPDGPSMLPCQNPPPSGTGSSPGSHISGTGYNGGGSATVAAAAPEYHGQNNYGPSVNRWPPAQGGYADGGNYATSSGYPTQTNMTPAGPRGPHAGMYHGGHPDYKSEERARRAVVDSVKCTDGYQVMCKMAVDGKKGRAGGGMMSSRGPVPGIVNADGRTSYTGYPDGPSMLPRKNPPPSGTGSSPGSHISGTGYNGGGFATVAAAAPEYHGQNNYGPSMNRWPPAQGGYADGGNYATSSGYPTQPNMKPACPRGPHAGMYHGGHPDYKSEERARRAVVDSVKCIDGYH